MSFFKELKRRNVFRVGIAYTVATWLLIQVADIVFPRIGLPDSAVTLVIALLAIGFIPALIFAWAFEMTPEGIKRESEIDRTQSITPKTGRKLNRVITAGLVVIIFVMGVERIWFANQDEVSTQPPSEDIEQAVQVSKSIAVLPFADMSEAKDQEWFADGLAEEILNALARAPDLLVSSRTSSFAYKGTQTPIAQIADELGVAHILEGSVRRAGDRIRVTAQLIRANDGFHVWSENYDRDVDDIIAIQEDLAVSIAKALKTTMDPDALAQMLKAGTRSVEAYEHYLNGLSLNSKADQTSIFTNYLEAYAAFEMARETDPQFSAAHGLAALFWRQQLSISRRGANQTEFTPLEIQTRFRERIEKAIETANSGFDRKRHLLLEAAVDFRVKKGIKLALELIETRPYDIEVLDHLADFAIWGSDAKAEKELLDRFHANWESGANWAEGYISSAWRVTEPRSITEFAKQAIARYPNNLGLIYQAHRALLWQGEVEQASQLLTRLRNEDADSSAIIQARQACAEGRRSDAVQILENIDSKLSAGDKAAVKWHILQTLGRHNEANEALRPWEEAEVPLSIAAHLIYPDFDPSEFPVVQAIIERESIQRPPPREIPFACPDEDVIQQESIAVIPFTNMSNDTSNEPFTVGIHDDLLTQISKIGSIRTISRTSVLRYKGTDKTIPQIAAELGVSVVLEGGVQRVGDLVRINVQLIDAKSDEHLWAETYDRELSAVNIFAIQSEIAGEIARQLKVTLSPDDQRRLDNVPTNSLLALEAYFEGKLLADQRSRKNIEAAILKFEQAIEYDPEFALAYSGLVYAWLLIPEYSASVDRGLSRRNSEKAAAKALELDPNLPEGLTVMAWNHMAHRYDWVTAEALLRKALDESANNSDTLHWLSHVLSFQGRHAEAIQVAEKAVESDPYSALMRMNLSYILADNHQYDRAVELGYESLAIRADNWEAWRSIWLTLLRAGRYSKATHAMSQWSSGFGVDPLAANRLSLLLEQHAETGKMVEIPTRLLDELEIGSHIQAQVYAAAGDAEATLSALRIAVDERAGSRSALSMKINPLYDFIRHDSRFIEMQKEVGLAP